MMQNSLDRLLGGIALALRADIAPAVQDPLARRQAIAGAELLEQLSSRVTWRPEEQRRVAAAVWPLLDEALALAPHAPKLAGVREAVEHPADDPLVARDAHLRALADVQRWLPTAGEQADGLRARVRTASAELLALELEHLDAALALARRAAA